MSWKLQLVIGGYGINQGGGVVVMVVMMKTVETVVMVVMVIGGYGTNHGGGVVVMVAMVIGGYGTNHSGGVAAQAKMMDQQKNLRRLRNIPCLLLHQNVSFCVSTTPRGMVGCLT